jgi:hypothetical protein
MDNGISQFFVNIVIQACTLKKHQWLEVRTSVEGVIRESQHYCFTERKGAHHRFDGGGVAVEVFASKMLETLSVNVSLDV